MMTDARRKPSLLRAGATVSIAAILAAGCARGIEGRYAPPAVRVPATWPAADTAAPAVTMAKPTAPSATDAVAATGRWWQAFGDPVLDRLVAGAFAGNNDLAAAGVRVRIAQLQAGLADAALWPVVNGSISTSDSRSLKGGSAQSNPSTAALVGRASSFSVGPSYEVDLWNRLGSQRDVARWEAAASEQDRASTAQALAGTTATLYWQLGYLGQRIDTGATSVAYAEQTLELVRVQYRAGSVSALEVADAEQNLASQRAAQVALEEQRVEAANALALLFDGRPHVVDAEALRRLPDGALPVVATGLPAELLGRRPDLRAAELRLREAFATIAATRASYYPALTLNASVGGSSTALSDLLRNPVGTLGAGLTLPFLQIPQRRLNIRISEAQYAEAVVNFRQTLYQALTDVDNALSQRAHDAARQLELDRSLTAARESERLYAIRYRVGAIALRPWLDAQDRRRTAENAVAENRYDQLVHHATLLRVLGGGTTAN